LAVNSAGNIYIADFINNAVKEWTAANSNVTTLVSSGLAYPEGVAVDDAGNVYIADTVNNAIKEWNVANGNVTTLVSTGLSGPWGVAVDGAGNVYIADTYNNAIKKWNMANNTVSTLVATGLFEPHGIAVDGKGNVYIADTINNAIKELPHAFVDPTAKSETPFAGSDTLPVVLPATANLTGPFAPVSDSAWLTITGSANGVVSFAFTATTTNRTANITLLGQAISVTQIGPTYSLGTTHLLEGNLAGSDSVVLSVTPAGAIWTTSTNDSWLHLSAGNQNGAGSTNVIFTLDANSGATRIGTLTIAGQTLTVTQAGSTYVAANLVTTLVSSGLLDPEGVAVDSTGNVYIADTGNQAIKKWTAANNTVTTLALGLSQPRGVAVDGAGNVYIADQANNAIKEWMATSNTVTTLVASGLNYPWGVAVDGAGNVYMADYGNNAIKELLHAFVDPTAKAETAAAGNDALPVVLPATANLTGPFAPASDSDWLTINRSINGVVSFAFTANPFATSRTANISLLGQTIPVTQSAAPVIPPNLTGLTILSNGAFQFCFINNQGASFTVLTTTNLSLPLTNWTVLGTPTNNGSGQYQFTDLTATNYGQRFYRVSSP
jgi:DNA-binding beta-propeller fold protein YncE